ncbi:MAG: GNAT family N-acetyltransferase [Actinobacteria bacterium]|nr:GNAT family N-acetyltransferase [Actinomycetota bacterium]
MAAVLRTGASATGGAEQARLEWLPEIVAFADGVFRASGRGSMAGDYPCLFDPGNVEHLFVHREHGRIAGLAGALPCDLLLDGRPVRAAGIGSVATAPHLRGHGVASRLLGLAEEALRHEGCRLLLISGGRGLYRRFGAVRVGSVRWYRLDRPLAVGSRWTVTRLRRDGLSAAAQLYDRRRTRYVRTPAALDRLFAAAGFAAAEQGEQAGFLASDGVELRAYAIVVSGARHHPDVQLVSEWAGDPDGLAAIFDAVLRAGGGAVLVPLLDADAELAERLPGSSAVPREPFPYTVKVIDGVGLWEDLGLGAGGALGERSPGVYTLGVGDVARTLGAAGLTSLLFGHTSAIESWPPPALPEVLPVPFVWPQGLNYV